MWNPILKWILFLSIAMLRHARACQAKPFDFKPFIWSQKNGFGSVISWQWSALLWWNSVYFFMSAFSKTHLTHKEVLSFGCFRSRIFYKWLKENKLFKLKSISNDLYSYNISWKTGNSIWSLMSHQRDEAVLCSHPFFHTPKGQKEKSIFLVQTCMLKVKRPNSQEHSI